MASADWLDPLVVSYVVGGFGIFIYLFFLWLRIRGIYVPSRRMANFIRILCILLVLVPVGMRYQYSSAAILYLSAAMFVFGFLIKLKQKMGI